MITKENKKKSKNVIVADLVSLNRVNSSNLTLNSDVDQET